MTVIKFSENELVEIKNIKIGKWDIIAEYHRIDWITKGHDQEEAKIHGIVIAIVGYQSRLGKKTDKYDLEKKNGEKGVSITHRKQDKWITSKEFDKIIKNLGKKYYDLIFSPAIQNLYDAGFSYEAVKKKVDIPSQIGAKITLDKFIPFIIK
ncbi:MAG: hypothetical protein ACFFBP_18340 [Promethearchaeota archaeon]